MTGKEQDDQGKSRTSTDRATKHHLQPRLLAALCERVLMQNAEARLLFAVEIKRILAEDPAFAQAFAEAFAPPRRGPRPATFASPLATIVQNVATLPDYVAALAENVGNVSPKVATFSQVGSSNGVVAPSPPPPPPSLPSSPRPLSPPLPPTTTALTPTESTNEKPRHEHWDALTTSLGEARTRSAKNTRGQAVKDLKEAGYSPAEIEEAARRWPSVMGDVLMTDMSMVKWIGKCLGGQQLRKHTLNLYETATKKHQPGFNSPEEYRRD